MLVAAPGQRAALDGQARQLGEALGGRPGEGGGVHRAERGPRRQHPRVGAVDAQAGRHQPAVQHAVGALDDADQRLPARPVEGAQVVGERRHLTGREPHGRRDRGAPLVQQRHLEATTVPRDSGEDHGRA